MPTLIAETNFTGEKFFHREREELILKTKYEDLTELQEAEIIEPKVQVFAVCWF